MCETPQAPTSQTSVESHEMSRVIIDCKIDYLYYGTFLAVRDSYIPLEQGKISAFIGPSGCGKGRDPNFPVRFPVEPSGK